MLTFINDFLDHHSWVPGVFVAILLFLVSWRWRLRDRDTKTLDYRIEEDEPILTGAGSPNSLRVLFDDKVVLAPRITRIRFENTGKQVIKPSEIIKPFVIGRDGAKILDARLSDGSEWGLASLDGSSDRKSLVVTPETLNSGDWFSVRILYDGGADSTISVFGKIEGQTRRPELQSAKENWASFVPTTIVYGILSTTLLTILSVLVVVPKTIYVPSVISWLVVFSGLTGMLFYANETRLYRQHRRRAISGKSINPGSAN